MAAQTTANKPRLRNLDELFKLDVSTTLEAVENSRFAVVKLEQLIPFPGHPFCLYSGERLEDMIESIRANGVLTPIIVRQKGAIIEILSGHNRVAAAKQAGLAEIPAIILTDVSDEDAMVYVVETNLMQRSFADMSHSEKAAVIALQHSKLFSQGKRNDIIAELEGLESAYCSRGGATFGQLGQKLDSRENIAREYSLSSRTVARYQRIYQLTDAIKVRLDNGEVGFIPAVTLSFLNENEQSFLDKSIELNNFSVDMKKAELLRQYSAMGKLDEDSIYFILSGEAGQKPKPSRTPTVKVSKVVYSKYFRVGQPAKEVQATVEKALEFYFSYKQTLG